MGDEAKAIEREIREAFKWPTIIVASAGVALILLATWVIQGCAPRSR